MKIALMLCLASLLNTLPALGDNACVKTAVLHWTVPDIDFKKTPAEVKRANADRLTAYINEAAEKGARVIVTPELSLVGYPKDRDFNDKKEALPFAEPIPDAGGAIDAKASPQLAHFADLASKKRAFLHIGMLEKVGADTIYNVTVVFGPDGKIVAKHRKVQLVAPPDGNEAKYLTAGTTATAYDASAVGLKKIGLAICADIYNFNNPHLMEAYRSMNDLSAVAISAAWATDSDSDKGPTNTWTAWQFFEESAKYLNNDAAIPRAQRYFLKNGKYKADPARNVATLVSNMSAEGPGAGIFQGPTRVLDSKRGAGNDGLVIGCIAGTPIKDGQGGGNGTHGPKK